MICFGTAGWSYEDWYGPVYPHGAKNFNPLKFLINYVDTIEINSTFYFPPSKQTVSNWAQIASSKENFTYSVKLWERFTHKINIQGKEDEKTFKGVLDILKDKNLLNSLLIQFPWSYKNTDENRRYFGALSRIFPYA